MTQEPKSGDRQIEAFRNSLTRILGADNFPPEALGDLSDLLDTLRRGVNILTGLMELRRGFEQAPAAKLHELEILVADDLRMVVKDLVPSLKKLRKAAYAKHGGDRQTPRR
jgi:hypothetical protein